MDRTSRATDYRFIKEPNGALTITNVMLEDDGKWQCEAENSRRYTENARPVKLVVLGEYQSELCCVIKGRVGKKVILSILNKLKLKLSNTCAA